MSPKEQRLVTLRQDIAKLDAQILKAVQERLRCAARIGEVKKKVGLPLRDEALEQSVLARNLRLGAELGLEPELVQALTELLVEASLKAQAGS